MKQFYSASNCYAAPVLTAEEVSPEAGFSATGGAEDLPITDWSGKKTFNFEDDEVF